MKYLLKSGFSAVDTSVGYSIHMGSMFVNISEFKNVENYYHKLKSRAAFKKSLPKDINDPLEKINLVNMTIIDETPIPLLYLQLTQRLEELPLLYQKKYFI